VLWPMANVVSKQKIHKQHNYGEQALQLAEASNIDL